MENNQTSQVNDIAALAQKPFFLTDKDGREYVAIPEEDNTFRFDTLECYKDRPYRHKGALILHDVPSFIEVIKRYGNATESMIYIDADYADAQFSATAVFDDNSRDQPGWRDHTAKLKVKHTAEWRRWLSNSGTKMTQLELAYFFENNIADFRQPEGMNVPSGSDVLAFVTNLQETRKVSYGSAIALQNGMTAIHFTEEGDKGTSGKLELFKEFCVGVRPYYNGSAYPVKAFLRYRIDRNTAGISFWYELQGVDRILEDACAEMIKNIQENSGLPVVFGC